MVRRGIEVVRRAVRLGYLTPGWVGRGGKPHTRAGWEGGETSHQGGLGGGGNLTPGRVGRGGKPHTRAGWEGGETSHQGGLGGGWEGGGGEYPNSTQAKGVPTIQSTDSSLHMYTVNYKRKWLTLVVRRGIEVVRRAFRLGSFPCQSKY